jgi:hypothetical protein
MWALSTVELDSFIGDLTHPIKILKQVTPNVIPPFLIGIFPRD